MTSNSQKKQFLKLLELEKNLENNLNQTSEKLKEYTFKKSKPVSSSFLASFGTSVLDKAVWLKDNIGLIANAREFIKNNYISLVILMVTIFLTSCSSLIFFVFSNLKSIISTFTQILQTILNYTLDFGTSIKNIIYDRLVSIIIQRLTHECCIRSSSATNKGTKNIEKDLRNISRHNEKANNGNLDTTCKAIFALSKPFSTIMTTVKSSFEYIYTSLIEIFHELILYFSKKSVTVVEPEKENVYIDVKNPETSFPPTQLNGKQQFYPEINVRRQLYIQSCTGSSAIITRKFMIQAVYTLSAFALLIVFVPGISNILMMAKFLSKTFLLSNLVSLLQNGKILAYIAGLQVFVALYLCCIYKRQPTVANTKLITRKFVKNKILRCSASDTVGLMQRLTPFLNMKTKVLRNSFNFLVQANTFRKNFDFKNGIRDFQSLFKYIVNTMMKVCDPKNISDVFTLLHQLVNSEQLKEVSITRTLTEKIQALFTQILSYFSGNGNKREPDTDKGVCKESSEYEDSILGCALFSYYDTYKTKMVENSSLEKDAREFSFEAVKTTLEEIKESFTVYDAKDSEKIIDRITPNELLLYNEIGKKVSKVEEQTIDQFCNYLQLTVLLHDKLDEALRLKMKSLQDFVEIVLQKYSFDFFNESYSNVQGLEGNDNATFYELGESILSLWEQLDTKENLLVENMNRLLYNEKERLLEEERKELVRPFRERLLSCEAYEKVVCSMVEIFKLAKSINNDGPQSVLVEKTKNVLFSNNKLYVKLKYHYDNTSKSVTFSCDFSKVYTEDTQDDKLSNTVIIVLAPIKITLHTEARGISSIFSKTIPVLVQDEKDIAFVIANYQEKGMNYTLFSSSISKLQGEFKEYLQESFFVSLKKIANPPLPQNYNDSLMTFFDESNNVNYFVIDPVTRFGLYYNKVFYSFSGTSYVFYLSKETFEKFVKTLNKEENLLSTDNYHKFQALLADIKELKPRYEGGSLKKPFKRRRLLSRKRGKHSSLLPIL